VKINKRRTEGSFHPDKNENLQTNKHPDQVNNRQYITV